MTPQTHLAAATALLAAGTFTLRLTGLWLRTHVELTPRQHAMLATAVAVLFSAVIATSTLLDGQALAGIARPAGVTAAGVLAWRGASFITVVLAATATTTALRLLGIP